MSKKIALVALVVILVLVNWFIAGKEKQLAEGRVVYLELAPVDPRSLMQGDYLALRFKVANEVYKALPKTEDRRRWGHDVAASDGYAVVSLDGRQVGTFRGLYDKQALAANDILMRYRVRNGAVKFATNAYFFQEGHGKYYQTARCGQFRVDDKGELLLVAMYDKDLNKLEPNE
jgi:uncharacterized membrane-anchored protein